MHCDDNAHGKDLSLRVNRAPTRYFVAGNDGVENTSRKHGDANLTYGVAI